MTLHVHYSHPTTPDGTGYDIDLGDVLLLATAAPGSGFQGTDALTGMVTAAAVGDSATTAAVLDDPSGTLGNAGDGILGLHRMYFKEDACPSNDQVQWNGYVGAREYRRASAMGFTLGAARRITTDLSDDNLILGFKQLRSFKRPAETADARLAALMAAPEWPPVFDDGLVNHTGLAAVNMPANDYTKQFPRDVLSDIAVQTGFNYWCQYNADGSNNGHVQLWVDDSNTSSQFSSTLQLSNYAADIDNVTVFSIHDDAVQRVDPSRTYADVDVAYSGGDVWIHNAVTAYRYGDRTGIYPNANITTSAAATVAANKFLADAAEENVVATVLVTIPAAKLNLIKAGMRIKCRFSHFSGPFGDPLRYQTFWWWRITRRAFARPMPTEGIYEMTLELVPQLSAPSAAFSAQQTGVGYSGQPTLPHATRAGDVLLMAVVANGGTSNYPTDIRMFNNPPVSPAPPNVPPYAGHAGWTVLKLATTDYSGQNIGGPCGEAYQGPFHGAAGNCTSGVIVGLAWRRVLAGEESTTPVGVSTNISGVATTGVWLYNLGNIADLGAAGSGVESDGNLSGNAIAPSLPTLAGNLVAVFGFPLAAGHGAVVQPTALGSTTGTAVQANAETTNHDLPAASNADNWGTVVNQPAGGVVTANVTAIPAGAGGYTSVNWAGVAAALPIGVTLPTIPYPANQVG